MKKLVIVVSLIAQNFTAQNVFAAQGGSTILITGVVEHFVSVENEATVKLVGLPKHLFIKNLTGLSENKLEALVESQSSHKEVQFKVDEKNQVVDVVP